MEVLDDHHVHTVFAALDDVRAELKTIARTLERGGAGPREQERLNWGATGTPHADLNLGETARGFLILNDGPTDAYAALAPDQLNAAGALFTIPAGTWLAIPLETRRLFFGGATATTVGSALVMVLDDAPQFGIGRLAVASAVSPAATVTKETLTGAVQTLAAANGSRRGLAIYNDSTTVVYIKLGAAATTDDWTYELVNQGDYYEVPAGYTGIVTAISGAATGQVRVTELT